MPKKAGWVKLSGYLFLLGILVAVVDGLVAIPYAGPILLIVGVVVGLLGALGMGGIDKADVQMFLLAVVALIAAGQSGAVLIGLNSVIPQLGTFLARIVGNISALVMPVAVILALEAIWRAGSVKF